MYNVLIAGAGKIGTLVACLLANTEEYDVHLADMEFVGSDVCRLLATKTNFKTAVLDVRDQDATFIYLKKHQITAVISSLPYFLNTAIAQVAKSAKAHYFDLSEDTSVAKAIKALASDAETAFVPQCGLAPGFVGIVANNLMQEFDQCYHAKLRVGALPQRVSNALHYSLTWSTDGLINEYGNPCYAIERGMPVLHPPLEGLESIQIDGCAFEAFNTSGGLGSLATLYEGKIHGLNYKTIRYPGHCEKIRFLMNELKLNEDRNTLKAILEKAIPKTYQDVVLIYIAAEGIQQGVFIEKSYIKKIYPAMIHGLEWSAIQVATASGICVVVDLILEKTNAYRGFILQEELPLAKVLANRFAHYFI